VANKCSHKTLEALTK